MPEDGISLTRPERLLATDELERLATIFVRAGVTKIRLTGGEPTLRADLVDVVRSIDALRPLGLREISMTTNGIALERKLPELRAAGLDRINISLDTLRRERFVELTRRDGLDKVLSSMRAALDLGFAPLKLNCVVMKGVNDGEVLDFARLTLASDVHVRFIEFMPFDGNRWSADRILPHHELVSRLRDAHGGLERVSNDAHDVARSWRIPGARGTVSTIASMTQPFCAGCNRIRLTADGAFMTCLFGKSEVSLRDALRAGESDDAILVRVWDALQRKHAAHAGMHSIAKATRRPMTTIGG
jgi:cyclic pyranopterin phosphate synthase